MRDFLVVWPLARRLAALRPAILQTFLFHANIVGRLAGTAARVPVIVSGIRVAEKRSRLRLWLDRFTDRLVTRHICVSRDVADFSAQVGRLPSAKMSVIPNGVDVDHFANAVPVDLAQFGVPAGSRVLLFVGRLEPQKGPFELLHAAAQLVVDHADVHLLMVGDGPLASDLRAWTTVAKSGIADSLRGSSGQHRRADAGGRCVRAAVSMGGPAQRGAGSDGRRNTGGGHGGRGDSRPAGDGKWGRVVRVGPETGDGGRVVAEWKSEWVAVGKMAWRMPCGRLWPIASSHEPPQPSAKHCQRKLYVAHRGRGLRAALCRIGRPLVQVTHKRRSTLRIWSRVKKS